MLISSKVFKANRIDNPQVIVALKKIELEKETQGFPITALREIINLKKLDHPNIVCLKDVVMSKRKVLEKLTVTLKQSIKT